jgi:hypothetical protein
MSYRAPTATLLMRTPVSDPREEGTMRKIGFLGVPEATAEAQTMFDEDIAELGYVMNVSRLWAYQPATVTGLFALLSQVNSGERLSVRQRSVLVTACASAFGDS